MGFHMFFLAMHQVRLNFFCFDWSGSTDNFLFPQNKCAYFLCVILTPLICAIYLTIDFMFNFQYYFMYHLVLKCFFPYFSESENSF